MNTVERTPLRYQPQLDGLRAVAVALVLLQHLNLPLFHADSAGTLGVDTFFVLSGFLITTLIADENHAHGGVSLRNFYARRALRLLPALYAALAVVVAFSFFASGSLGSGLRDEALAAGTYVYNFAALNGLQELWLYHTWSLSLEEQFYIVWPILFVWLIRRDRVDAAMAITWTAWVALVVSRLAGWMGPGDFFTNRPDALLLGCGIALVMQRVGRSDRTRVLIGRLGVVATVGWLAVLAVQGTMTSREFVEPYLRYFSGLFALSTAGIIVAMTRVSPRAFAALGHRVPVYVGRRSYSLYLWHLPMFKLVGEVEPKPMNGTLGLALRLSLAFFAAWLSYAVVERPALALKARISRGAP